MDDTARENIKEILSHDSSSLKREQGDFQFTDVKKEIDAILGFVKDLSTNEDFYEFIPDNEQNSLRDKLQRTRDLFQEVKDFSPTSIPNPQDVRNALAERIRAQYRELFPNITQLDVFRLRSKGAQGKLANITSEAKNVLKDSKDAYKQIEGLLQASKATTSSVSLYEYVGIFGGASKKYRKIAYIWLGVSAIMAIALLILLYLVGADLSKTIIGLKSTQAIIGVIVVKLFFIAIAVYVLQQFIRNYMANMHQAVLNEQRENSLKVFDAMIKSTSTAETADQVLSYLSKSIFDSGETGFFPGKDISKDGPDLIQIFKDIGKPK